MTAGAAIAIAGLIGARLLHGYLTRRRLGSLKSWMTWSAFAAILASLIAWLMRVELIPALVVVPVVALVGGVLLTVVSEGIRAGKDAG